MCQFAGLGYRLVTFLGWGMGSIPGSQYDVYAGGQQIFFNDTSGTGFHLEVVYNASGTGNGNIDPGYDGLVYVSTDAGHTVLTMAHGDFKVTDSGSNDSIYLGDGAETIVGATGDTLYGGTGNNQFLDGTQSAQ